MNNTVEFICVQCGNVGVKSLVEFNRNKRLKRENFCSRICSGKHNGGRIRETKKCSNCDREYMPSSGHLMCPTCRAKLEKKPCGECGITLIQQRSKTCRQCAKKYVVKKERNDEFFMREVYRRVKLRCRTSDRLDFDVDPIYLMDVWNSQEKKCIYTSIDLTLPTVEKNDRITTASLDRIDSSMGYIKGNVQFVSMAVNYMKNSMSHEETVKLIELIKSTGDKYKYN